MDVKYVVIDLSKIDTNKLEEMLTKAYTDGYQRGRECVGGITAPTIPYNGDTWQTITNYVNSAESAISGISVKGTELDSCTIAVGSELEPLAVTIANDVSLIKNS